MAHRMPVITPAYPSMCSTHNITASTMSIIKSELHRGESHALRIRWRLTKVAAIGICDEIQKNPGSSWRELFEPLDFFDQYRTYVQVIASASTAERLKDWYVLFNYALGREMSPRLGLTLPM